MKRDEPREPTREESLESWRRRQEQEAKERKKIGEQNQRRTEELERKRMRETKRIKGKIAETWRRLLRQDQRSIEELEREPWRLSKRIRVQDPYHFVINPPTLIERLLGSVLNKAVIDKRTESVTVERRYLFLIHRERIIPFSAVRSVVLDYYEHIFSGQGQPPGEWRLSLNTHSEKVIIESGTERNDMCDLANAISKIIKKKLEITSNEAKFSSTDFDFPSSRPPPYSL